MMFDESRVIGSFNSLVRVSSNDDFIWVLYSYTVLQVYSFGEEDDEEDF